MGSTEFLQTSKTRETLAIAAFSLFVIIPSLGYNGFIFEFLYGMNQQLYYAVVMIGGTIAFFITNLRRVVPNLVAGTLSGAGVAIATGWYLAERSSIYKIELVIPMLIGGIPGILVYFLMVKYVIRK